MTFLSHSSTGLQLATDDGHRLHFRIDLDSGHRQLTVGTIEWMLGRQPLNASELVQRATVFATECGQDCGIL